MTRQLDEGQNPMWDYWKNKKGYTEALNEFYPDALMDPQIQAAYAQYQNSMILLDSLMEKWEVEFEG
tara:strand:+ start:84 stop:284 length:201 start_codon:yes stop_codon:yes gene_type:complete